MRNQNEQGSGLWHASRLLPCSVQKEEPSYAASPKSECPQCITDQWWRKVYMLTCTYVERDNVIYWKFNGKINNDLQCTYACILICKYWLYYVHSVPLVHTHITYMHVYACWWVRGCVCLCVCGGGVCHQKITRVFICRLRKNCMSNKVLYDIEYFTTLCVVVMLFEAYPTYICFLSDI